MFWGRKILRLPKFLIKKYDEKKRLKDRFLDGFNGHYNIISYYTESDFLSNEQYAGYNPIKYLAWYFTPPDGKRIYLGAGGHTLEGICRKLELKPISYENKEKISNGEIPF